MNPAEVATVLVVERSLSSSPAYRKIDDSLHVVKQGSTYVLINVVPWGGERALVRVVAQLLKGVRMDAELAVQLLGLNARLRFGAFAWDADEQVLLFLHSLLGGPTLDAEELLATVRDVALVADEYDGRIRQRHGGETMQDLLEEATIARILERDPDALGFGRED
jgi:hypothetical protein